MHSTLAASSDARHIKNLAEILQKRQVADLEKQRQKSIENFTHASKIMATQHVRIQDGDAFSTYKHECRWCWHLIPRLLLHVCVLFKYAALEEQKFVERLLLWRSVDILLSKKFKTQHFLRPESCILIRSFNSSGDNCLKALQEKMVVSDAYQETLHMQLLHLDQLLNTSKEAFARALTIIPDAWL